MAKHQPKRGVKSRKPKRKPKQKPKSTNTGPTCVMPAPGYGGEITVTLPPYVGTGQQAKVKNPVSNRGTICARGVAMYNNSYPTRVYVKVFDAGAPAPDPSVPQGNSATLTNDAWELLGITNVHCAASAPYPNSDLYVWAVFRISPVYTITTFYGPHTFAGKSDTKTDCEA